jgi:SAM-dependent methyltransferase
MPYADGRIRSGIKKVDKSESNPDNKTPPEIPLGSVRFGDLRRFSPIGRNWGYERGMPVARYYIEGFLARHANDVRGRVLELGSNDYTTRFGGARVEKSDVLAVETTNRNATIVGDLTDRSTLPEAVFDCIIFTQALHYIYDVRVAIEMLHRALKPHGVLLTTAPGIGPMGDHPGHPERPDRWPWYWIFTLASLRRVLEERFGRDAVTAEAHGNIFTATAFLYGLALEDLDKSDLEVDDPRFPVAIAARALKRAEA